VRVPRKAVSDCRRIRSMTDGEGCKVCAVPLAGVRVTPEMETLNERIEGFAASGLSMKVAGRKGETREHDYEKQRFVANHPTPHDRPVCDSLLYLLPTRRRKNSRLNLNAEGKGRHSKNGRSIRVLNILKEERCATMFPSGARTKRAQGKGMLS